MGRPTASITRPRWVRSYSKLHKGSQQRSLLDNLISLASQQKPVVL
jgi:hypothetical protein